MAGPCIFQWFVQRTRPRNSVCRGNTNPLLVFPPANRSVPAPSPRVVQRWLVYPSLEPGLLFCAQGIVSISRVKTISKLPAQAHQQFDKTLSVVRLAQPLLQLQIV